MLRRSYSILCRLVRRFDFWIAVTAGIVYSSWPLGFLLNPAVAHHDFASQLEASGQPFNWVFIGLDIASGLILCTLGVRQWRQAKGYADLRMSVLGYMLFGLFTILAAIVPDNCPDGQECRGAHSPLVMIHGLASVISVIFLLAALLLPLRLLWARHHYHWIGALITFVAVGWGLTGIGTLIVIAEGMRSNWLQYDLISVCSLSIIFCMAMIGHLLNPQQEPVPAQIRT